LGKGPAQVMRGPQTKKITEETMKNWLKFLFCPNWRRDYKLNKMIKRGRTALEACAILGVVKNG